MKKTIILTVTAVVFVAGSILAFANTNLDEKATSEQCPPECCNGGGSSCCKK